MRHSQAVDFSGRDALVAFGALDGAASSSEQFGRKRIHEIDTASSSTHINLDALTPQPQERALIREVTAPPMPARWTSMATPPAPGALPAAGLGLLRFRQLP